MKKLFLILTLIASVSALASLRFTNQYGLDLGSVSDATCTAGVGCSVVGGKVLIGVGQAPMSSVAISVSPTAADCGKTYVNSAAVIVTLPQAVSVLGCRLTFIVGHVSVLTVNPFDGTDQIVLLTNAAGDSIAADAIGESVTLQAMASAVWAPVGAEKGTWSDTN